MSKVNAMQAMREARYAAARTIRPATTPVPPPAPARRVTPDRAGEDSTDQPQRSIESVVRLDAEAAPEELIEEPAEALCGHRSMNNRSCRRPAGHAEKNHRYN